ncbi:MAG: isochorismatase family protein [Proteobacteria bacterium]|nr:isochorismatase family protein [Pseudomonadota bacterium]MBU1388755.1 isochorismatase family protein [Pseudomonadota bacterium]MBU1543096.1 isochorismatase family protein [Pseudomonadota bacterium]MBU2482025.1 isochorismatase family protein [Pseudomonadota bacterium]
MFTIDRTVMILIDVQGKLAQIMYDRDHLFSSLQIIIQSMQILGVPVIWMEQIPKNLGNTAREISECIVDNQPIAKSSFSCCGEPEFLKAFEKTGRTQVLLTGIEAHICVFQTAYDLIHKGCEVQVVSDCVSSRTKENKDIGIHRIVQSGGQMTCVEMAVFELLGQAGGDKFKQIIKLIK